MMEAYALTCRAYTLSALGLLDRAVQAAQEALELRRALGNRTLVLETLAALCHIRLSAGETEAARSIAEEILAVLGGPELPQRSALNGAEQTLRVVWVCYRTMCSAKDERAGRVLAATRQWLEDIISPFSDDEARRSLLENVPWHREIVLNSAVALDWHNTNTPPSPRGSGRR